MASTDDNDEKMLGALVPNELYWQFKKAAAERNESMKTALEVAARLYVEITVSPEKEVKVV